MEFYVVKYFDNWADEMDLSSIVVIDGDTKEKLFKQFDKYEGKETAFVEFYFGTNEFNEYDFAALKNCLIFFSVTPEEAIVINRYTADMRGIVNNVIEFLLDDSIWVNDEEEEEGDE